MAWAWHRLWPTEVSPAMFSAMKGSRLASADSSRFFNAPVLVAQLDLQIQHPFADAVEAEMARFDHAGMHRTDGHLVDFIPGNRIIVVSARDVFGVVVAECIVDTAAVGVVAHHFEPRMTFGNGCRIVRQFPARTGERVHIGPSMTGRASGASQAADQQYIGTQDGHQTDGILRFGNRKTEPPCRRPRRSLPPGSKSRQKRDGVLLSMEYGFPVGYGFEIHGH